MSEQSRLRFPRARSAVAPGAAWWALLAALVALWAHGVGLVACRQFGVSPIGVRHVGQATAPAPSRRVELDVLVLSARDVGTDMMKAGLREAGVPFTELELERPDRAVITEAFLIDSSRSIVRTARFQAIVAPNESPPQLSAEERETLNRYQREFGVRRADSYVYPSEAVHLRSPTDGGYSGVLDGVFVRITPEAPADSFGYLAGEVRFDDVGPDVAESYGYIATPLAADVGRGRSFATFVEAEFPGRGGHGALIGVFREDTREELVITCAWNAGQLHQQALFPGILNWLTRGVHFGTERHYLTVHIDDVLLSNARWISEYDCTRGNDCPADVSAPDIAMSADDVAFMQHWQAQNEFSFAFAYNGGGYDAALEDVGTFPVGEQLLAAGGYWINHTYTHEYLGCVRDQMRTGFPCRYASTGGVEWVSLQTADDEIRKNIEFARDHALALPRSGLRTGSMDARELVTGEHSGLRKAPDEPSDNPSLIEALRRNRIEWVAADASREWAQRALGEAHTVPRYPMNLFFNVGRGAELVDEFSWIHASAADGGSGLCERNSASTCLAPLDRVTGFESAIVPLEARALLVHALSNDPRPHYAHQSNLAEDRLLYPILDRVLSDYRQVFRPEVPLLQLTLTEAGTELRDQENWLTDRSHVIGYVQAGALNVTVTGTGAVRVPLTVPAATRGGDGGAALTPYAGQQTGWRTVKPLLGHKLTLPETVGYAR